MTEAAFEPAQLSPHSQDAEEAVLGSILINPDAYLEVAAFLKSDDFFILRNAWVWEAMTRLHERGEIIDYLTLIEELRAQERLDDIGGAAYITYLTSNVGTSIYAETYGRIVERASLRRRMLDASLEIARLAREEDSDINEVIEDAEQALFQITERRTRRDTVPLQEAISEYFDRIEYLYENRDEPIGVPTGFTDLDNLLGGLQKSDLIILAARPGVGKTSFMLNIAMNAARARAHVAIFSLEMSREQLVQRFVATETGIGTHKLRLGELDEREWGLFVEATGKLGDLKIYLDDTPALNVTQLRTKCRRLYRESGLDMVIVDYLQLMNGGSGRNENRVQEVSAISRGLKELARELNVPVLTAAQLSRAVEQRQDKRPQLSDLRESGCITGDSLVTMADTGEEIPIRELVGKSGFAVWALNEETMKIERAIVSNAFATGIKPVFRMTTRLGRTIRATANHKFRTISGWKRLDELCPGDYLAVPRKIDSPYPQTMSNAELALLGHLIGDGCTLPTHAVQYTTRELDLAETVAKLAVEVFGDAIQPRINPEHRWYQVYLTPTQHLTHNVRNPVGKWMEELGLWGKRSHEKFVPKKVFQQPAEAIAVFLRHLWATDGCINLVKGKRNRPIAYYASSSERLVRDVQSLLLHLGINARVKQVPQGSKGRDQYHAVITGKPDIEAFAQKINAVGAYKQAALQEITRYNADKVANTNRDIIPNDIWRMYVVPAMQQQGLTSREMQAALPVAYCGTGLYKQNISRERAARVANVVQSPEITALAESDIYWDEIVSIEHGGKEEVFDLTIPTFSNLISNSYVIHNSIEQDSDVVMFIYRDELYNEATDRPNEADIIVAKHRNGPTGNVVLFFRKQLTQFANIKKTDVNLGDF